MKSSITISRQRTTTSQYSLYYADNPWPRTLVREMIAQSIGETEPEG